MSFNVMTPDDCNSIPLVSMLEAGLRDRIEERCGFELELDPQSASLHTELRSFMDRLGRGLCQIRTGRIRVWSSKRIEIGLEPLRAREFGQRYRDREIKRQRDIDREKEIQRKRDREIEKQKDREIESQNDREIQRQNDREIERQKDRKIERQRDREKWR